MSDPAGPSRLVRTAGALVCLLLLAAQGSASFLRYFVNDDYQLLFTAWQRSLGHQPGRDFYVASFSPIFDVFVPLFRWFPESFVPAYAGRLAMVALLGACAWMLSQLAKDLFGLLASVLAPILFLASIPVLHRGIDLRPDLISTALFLWAFLVVARNPAPGFRAAMLLGAIVGLAMVNRFKSVVVLPPLAALVAWQFHARDGRLKLRALVPPLLGACLGMAIPAAICVACLKLQGTLGTYVDANLRLAGDANVFAVMNEGLRTRMVFSWLSADRLFAAAGLAAVVAAILARREARRWLPLSVALAATALISVAMNPAYYAYNLLTLSALCAPLAAWGPARALERLSPQVQKLAALGCICAFPLYHSALIAQYATDDSAAHQRAFTKFLLRYTPPDAPVFAMEGVGLFRPSNYHWRMPAILQPRYANGEWKLRDEWAKAPPEVIVLSYRVPDWLTEPDRAFLRDHYAPISERLLVPGYQSRTQAEETFEIVAPGIFEVVAEHACFVDGQPAQGELKLERGTHKMLAYQGKCMVRHAYPQEALALIANPRRREYLTPPELQPLPSFEAQP